MVPSDYVHRIGRTGRAGIEGDAISLVCVDEQPLLRDIQRLLGHKIEVENVEGFTPDRSIRPQPIRLRSAGHQGRPQGQGRPQSRSQHQAPRGNRPDYGESRPAHGESRPPKRWNPHRRHTEGRGSMPGERLSAANCQVSERSFVSDLGRIDPSLDVVSVPEVDHCVVAYEGHVMRIKHFVKGVAQGWASYGIADNRTIRSSCTALRATVRRTEQMTNFVLEHVVEVFRFPIVVPLKSHYDAGLGRYA